MKESEVSYQMAFSKQELRKVIKEYPGKEVKKGLDNLYRKVEKHLCEEENLLQVNIQVQHCGVIMALFLLETRLHNLFSVRILNFCENFTHCTPLTDVVYKRYKKLAKDGLTQTSSFQLWLTSTEDLCSGGVESHAGGVHTAVQVH